MSGYSNVGNRRDYDAGDQRNVRRADMEHEQGLHRYYESKGPHPIDEERDERSIATNLSRRRQKQETDMIKDRHLAVADEDPTLRAAWHNNEPSSGAKIDKELMKEDEEQMRRKGII